MKENGRNQALKEIKELKNKIKELENLLNTTKVGQTRMSTGLVYRTIFRMSPNTIVVSKLEDGTIYDVSDSFCEKSGFARKQVIGKRASTLGIWLDQDREEIKKRLLRNGRYRNMEVRHQVKGGKMLQCLQSAELITIDDERYIITVVVDITERKMMEERLRENEEKYRQLFDNAPAGIYQIDYQTGRFLNVNDVFCKYSGLNREELTSFTAFNFLTEESKKLFYARLEQIHQGIKVPEAVEYEALNIKGELLYLQLHTRFIHDSEGHVVGADVVIHDITERKQAEDELKSFAEDLEEANITLRVLMNQRDEDKQEIEEKLQTNMRDLVMPYLRKLKRLNLDGRSKNYLDILESNLNEVLSPFMKNLQSSFNHLTPQEMQIVSLIKKGKKTKEISEMLNASTKTIATHRNNLRKKLNLRNSKINLRSYLLSCG
ncbi:MAG TPA: PAS domain S-box protein [Smithella sp.]|nr:PAS domain S-box protein [Smithella sp.]